VVEIISIIKMLCQIIIKTVKVKGIEAILPKIHAVHVKQGERAVKAELEIVPTGK
jgi:hypothetical protein